MRTTSILTASAIALVAGVGSAAADEITGTSGGITEFQTLFDVQAMPLDSNEMASITAAHWLRFDVRKEILSGVNGHREHYAHAGTDGYAHGIIYASPGGPVYDDFSDDDMWSDPLFPTWLSAALHLSEPDL